MTLCLARPLEKSRNRTTLSLLSSGMEMGLGRRSHSSPLCPWLVQEEITLPLLTFKMLFSILYKICRKLTLFIQDWSFTDRVSSLLDLAEGRHRNINSSCPRKVPSQHLVGQLPKGREVEEPSACSTGMRAASSQRTAVNFCEVWGRLCHCFLPRFPWAVH